MKIKISWIEKLKFEGFSSSGHKVILDSLDNENSGPSPMEYFLFSLAGCSGMDIISILEKMKKKIEKFEIMCEGERRKECPRIFKKINIKYVIKGREIDEKSVQKAIELSKEKYCSVWNMISKLVEISYNFEILE